GGPMRLRNQGGYGFLSILISFTVAGFAQSVPPVSFQAAVNYGAGGDPISLAVGDFNGDGKPDLAVTDQGGGVTILLGNGDGSFQTGGNYPAGSGSSSVAMGDFNGDGKLDLAVTNWTSNNVSALLGNGDGTFQPAVNYAVYANPSSVTVGDFNG